MMATDIAVVRGTDGKVLGVTYDEDSVLDRSDCESWEDFLHTVAGLMFSRVPSDEISDHGRRLIAADNERLKELLAMAAKKAFR